MGITVDNRVTLQSSPSMLYTFQTHLKYKREESTMMQQRLFEQVDYIDKYSLLKVGPGNEEKLNQPYWKRVVKN